LSRDHNALAAHAVPIGKGIGKMETECQNVRAGTGRHKRQRCLTRKEKIDWCGGKNTKRCIPTVAREGWGAQARRAVFGRICRGRNFVCDRVAPWLQCWAAWGWEQEEPRQQSDPALRADIGRLDPTGRSRWLSETQERAPWGRVTA